MIRVALPLALLLASCAPQASTAYPTVSVGDLNTAVGQGQVVLDVRTPAKFTEGHIASAVNLPLDQVQARAAEVPSGQPVYVICRSGARSAQASAILKKAGKDVRNVGTGMNDWIATGYPVIR
ncbi:rhodanese-like domain-containing protein [Deinococcus sp.]|uniref:rhodanese-like domain-containing protein n=1 Tax=Deinococcus sp. TaxID=47478 RepID=UPI002869C5B3|nr:rhodanese-like domain-containing protein [Deinococcus sp.]